MNITDEQVMYAVDSYCNPVKSGTVIENFILLINILQELENLDIIERR
jgi:hypothetical protein